MSAALLDSALFLARRLAVSALKKRSDHSKKHRTKASSSLGSFFPLVHVYPPCEGTLFPPTAVDVPRPTADGGQRKPVMRRPLGRRIAATSS